MLNYGPALNLLGRKSLHRAHRQTSSTHSETSRLSLETSDDKKIFHHCEPSTPYQRHGRRAIQRPEAERLHLSPAPQYCITFNESFWMQEGVCSLAEVLLRFPFQVWIPQARRKVPESSRRPFNRQPSNKTEANAFEKNHKKLISSLKERTFQSGFLSSVGHDCEMCVLQPSDRHTGESY